MLNAIIFQHPRFVRNADVDSHTYDLCFVRIRLMFCYGSDYDILYSTACKCSHKQVCVEKSTGLATAKTWTSRPLGPLCKAHPLKRN